MYFGHYIMRVRAKNRIAFPSQLRKITGNRLFITNWFENSLLVLPKDDWENLVREIFGRKTFLLSETRDLDKFIYGGTYEVELDFEGRFVLPTYLKQYAKIEREVIVTGGMWYMTMWDTKVFENYQQLNTLQIKEKAIKVFQQVDKQNESK